MNLKGRKRKKELAAAIDRGRKLLVARNYKETLLFLEKAVQRFPDDAELRLLLASILLRFRPDDAASEAAKAVALAPDDPRILVRAGGLMLSRGEIEAARACADRANQIVQPDFVLMSSLLNLYGLLAALGGEDDLAEEKLRSAFARDPMYSMFAVDLANFLASRHRQTEAIAVIDDALVHAEEKEDLWHLREQLAGSGSAFE